MQLRIAVPEEFEQIRRFYWNLIDLMQDQNDTIGWKKGIYPTDEFLRDSLAKEELYVWDSKEENTDDYICCVILNSDCNEGYAGIPWQISCEPRDVLIPHALGIDPRLRKKGYGRRVVADILALGEEQGKQTVRLDILGTNKAAEILYTHMGFRFIQAKNMFYEDTGWTEYKMYEYVL